MDNINETKKKQRKKSRLPLADAFSAAMEKRRENPLSLLYDSAIFLIALVLARRHLLFGAHPLAIAFLAVIPSYVWVALFGAAVGSVTLGGAGFVYAIISVIVVFLRIVTSGTEGQGGPDKLFSESLVLRMAAALIGGFTAAVYELLLSGLTWTTVLFGLTMTLIPPIIVFAASGIFCEGLTPRALLFDKRNLFDLSKKRDKERYNVIFFQCAAALSIFFVGFALEPYSLLGISATYVFAGLITLVVAKRFGSLRAAGVGFFAVLGVSAMNSVAFALSGLVAGMLFSVGMPYALVGGGISVVAWSAYSGGFRSLIEIFPEYIIAAIIGAAVLKRITIEKTLKEEEASERKAKDMVGTMALSYRSGYSGTLPLLEDSLLGLSGAVKKFAEESAKLGLDDYRRVASEAVLSYCKTCPGYRSCRATSAAPYEELVGKIAEKLFEGKQVSARDFESVPAYCHMSNRIFEVINEQTARAEAERFKAYGTSSAAVDLEMLARLINDSMTNDERARGMNTALTELLEPVARSYGPEECVIRVYGDRKYHVIAAGEDSDGTVITSPEFKREMEKVMGVRLGAPEFFRSGSAVVMETDASRAFSVECASAGLGGRDNEISGDTVRIFESSDDRFYALLSDGMGSGKTAKDTSTFVGSFLSEILDSSRPTDTVMHLLSHIIRGRGTECSATVDLFGFDLINGEATFLKSGAAPSYIKRAESIFRIRSETAPIGLMKQVDAERIKASVSDGDYIIMLSDGISQSTEDAAWLLELLSKPPKASVGEYADYILAAAVKNSKYKDDMTVVVAKIKQL